MRCRDPFAPSADNSSIWDTETQYDATGSICRLPMMPGPRSREAAFDPSSVSLAACGELGENPGRPRKTCSRVSWLWNVEWLRRPGECLFMRGCACMPGPSGPLRWTTAGPPRGPCPASPWPFQRPPNGAPVPWARGGPHMVAWHRNSPGFARSSSGHALLDAGTAPFGPIGRRTLSTGISTAWAGLPTLWGVHVGRLAHTGPLRRATDPLPHPLSKVDGESLPRCKAHRAASDCLQTLRARTSQALQIHDECRV